MPKLKIGDKAIKTRNLIFGLRDARVAALLKPYGFSSAALEEAWGLVTKVTDSYLKTEAAKIVDAPDIVAMAGEFEDHWIPIVRIVLERRYPRVVEALYSNLVRVDGKDATTIVDVFLKRLDAMEAGAAPYGDEGPKVREYLRSRGLSDEVVAAAKATVDRLREVEPGAAVDPVDPVEFEADVKAMWDWYLEWSRLARRIIKDRNLLRLLGFKKSGVRRGVKKVDSVVVEENALPAAEEEVISDEKALPAPAESDDTAFAAE